MRSLHLSYEHLARTDGSARFGFGPNTHALASLSGPIEVRLAAELPSQATFEVHVRPLSNVPATEAKALASIVKSALSPSLILSRNPRTLVQLVVQALSPSRDGSGMVAAMINAATLAFLNAGSIPMKGIICAMPVGRRVGGELVVDPSEEEVEVEATGCFAFLVTQNLGHQEMTASCVHTSWKEGGVGSSGLDDLVRATELAKGAALVIADEMRESLCKMGVVPAFVFEEKGEGILKDKTMDLKMES
ncbi:uncharacterized protein LACBIDRAFT_299954 [Laccaria bicolor S238N-H82]|uniref:Predicted protein n=1 Tax=Laccaria bicolor (strain S238N-H82 / ATCC MYA-4686) TaxID=486041 RepID=B0DFQ7_LACBS|nr:uncharacterized protein LACBIDRAFT_299954 [Laccaria bicolor S238N-H82]EDR06501.1 predicted protein [Laccaria bicolor S238N-H82]|eukprot:XP_001882873.1 predicted protein [Laccaria bicolor S238N-H82]